jgi:penicillin amidase
MPGLPTVVLGQNEHIAWGFTNTGPDVQDLYIEQHPARRPRSTARRGLGQVRDRQETSSRSRAERRPDDGARTRHGPVISDAGVAWPTAGPRAAPATSWRCAGRRWTPTADPLEHQPGCMRAGSVGAFVRRHLAGWWRRCRTWWWPTREGRIGVVSPGRVPLRKPDNDLKGQVPAPGWDARYDWAGWVPARRNAARDSTRARLDRHRQPAHHTRLPALHHQRLGRRPIGSSASNRCWGRCC